MSTKVVSTLGTIPTLTVAGKVFTSIANNSGTPVAGDFVELFGWVQGGATNIAGLAQAQSIVSEVETVTYKPPAGLNLRIVALRLQQSNTTAIQGALQYSDTDIGLTTGTQGVNQVDEGGLHNASQGVITTVGSATVGTVTERTVNWVIPSGKYAAFVNWIGGGTCTLRVWGYLE